MAPRLFLWITASTLLAACKSHQPSNTPAADTKPAVIEVTESVTVTPRESEPALPYRASNPRSNDILHTRLDVSFDWTNSRLNGKAQLTVKPYFYATDKLFLDARGFEIKSIQVFEAAKPATTKPLGNVATVFGNMVTGSSFVYENDSIKINLGKKFTANEQYQVVIEYIAKPNELKKGGSNAITEDKGLYFINPSGENLFKMPQIWTQGETQASSAWFPTIDSPNEKMTQDIYMTVQDRFTTLSNGLLVESKKSADGTRTDHWQLNEPHSPYLAMMAVGEFVKVTDTPWNGKEVSYYVEKLYANHAKAIFGDTREMIDFFSNKLGVPYAWPKYAQIAVRDYVSGAMENTSATLHGDFMVYQTTRETQDEKKGNDVIAHELFHQWFGDFVTAESWSNLPLNESFATYGEYLWNEYKEGRDAADNHHLMSRMGYMASEKEKMVIRYHYEDKEEMFDGFSYNKGGQILHMLRKAVGDEAFFASLKKYLTDNQYKPAEIHHLRLAFEEVTGQDMNWFFNQWFLSKGRPKLNASWSFENGVVELTLKQKQDTSLYPIYTLPLDVDVYANGKVQRHRILFTKTTQKFRFNADGRPNLVNVDGERQLLCDWEDYKTDAELLFQFKNAPLFEDRLEAIKKLEGKLDNEQNFALYKEAALNDKYHAIRLAAMRRLLKAPAPKMPEVKAVLIGMYQKDTYSKNRAAALGALNNLFGADTDVKALIESAFNESSYAIIGEALEALTVSNPKLAMEKAKNLEQLDGRDIIFPIAALYANHGSDDQIRYFHNMVQYMTGFEMMTFVANYGKAAKRCERSESAISAVQDLESLSKGANRFTKFAITKSIKDILGAWEDKVRKQQATLDAAMKEGKATEEMKQALISMTETRDIIAKAFNRVK
jgi:aminopeptidase N